MTSSRAPEPIKPAPVSSAGWAGLRQVVWRALEPSAREGGRLSQLNWLIISLVVVSFVVLAIETELNAQARLLAAHATTVGFVAWPSWLNGFCNAANVALLAAFAAEFLVRLWAWRADPRYAGASGAVRYVFQPSTLADFLAFAPELAVTLAAPHAAGATLAALRLLRLLRLFKLMRYAPAALGDRALCRRASLRLGGSVAFHGGPGAAAGLRVHSTGALVGGSCIDDNRLWRRLSGDGPWQVCCCSDRPCGDRLRCAADGDLRLRDLRRTQGTS